MMQGGPTRTQRWDLYLGGVVRRYFLVMITIGFIGLIIGGFNTAAQWSPLVWIVPAVLLLGGLMVFVRRTQR